MSYSRRSFLFASVTAINVSQVLDTFAAQAESRKIRLSIPSLICRAKTEGGEDEIYIILAGRTSQGRTIVGRLPKEHWDLDEGNPAKAEIKDATLWQGDLPFGAVVEFTLFIMEEDESPSSNPVTLGLATAERTTVGGSPIGVKADVEKLRSDCFPHAGNPSIEVKKLEGTQNIELFGIPIQTNIPRKSVSVGVSFYNTDDCPGIVGIRLTLDTHGKLTSEYAARSRCEDKGWVEAKVQDELVPAIFPKEIIERIKQQELSLLTDLARKPTRQFWCKGDGSFYRLFLRAEIA